MEESNEAEFMLKLLQDSKLREEFKNSPAQVLHEHDISLGDRAILVLEDRANKKFFVLKTVRDYKAIEEKLKNTTVSGNVDFISALQDPEMREQLKQDPHTFLKMYGIEVPQTTKIEVVEDTSDITYWVLPNVTELEDANLEQITGGGTGKGLAAFGSVALFVANAPLGIVAGVLSFVYGDKIDAAYNTLFGKK